MEMKSAFKSTEFGLFMISLLEYNTMKLKPRSNYQLEAQ